MSTSIATLQPVDAVSVNREMCDRVAAIISSQAIPEDREEIPSLDIPHAYVGNFFLALVAICHRTSSPNQQPLIGSVNGITRRGWDYLFGRFYEAVRADLHLLTPARWIRFSATDIKRIFEDPVYGDRLVDPEGRASLIRDLGSEMMQCGWMFADEIFKYCRGRIATGHPNLLEVLSRFRAFSDPVRKKSLYFLAVMRNSDRWKYADDEYLGPPVDYHEVRGHLRLGTVQVNERTLLEKIRQGQPVTPKEDIVLRQAVYDAIVTISERSGIRNPSQLHYLFWNVFRSVCLRNNPQCFHLDETCTLPDRYRHLAEDAGSERCPFANVCRSAGVANPIREHTFDTDYY